MDKLDLHTSKGRKCPSSDIKISEAQTPKRPKTDGPKKVPQPKKSSSSFVTTPSSTTDMDLESDVTKTQNTPPAPTEEAATRHPGISPGLARQANVTPPPRIKGRAAPKRRQMAGKNTSQHTLSQIIKYAQMGSMSTWAR
ncbi:hypothetical protein JB92DRAFT_3127326 [Gautieria morchelliformis]|nr:hypothetical protein JB92DRAFT_3127326 [Gautieria morchelliformis]